MDEEEIDLLLKPGTVNDLGGFVQYDSLTSQSTMLINFTQSRQYNNSMSPTCVQFTNTLASPLDSKDIKNSNNNSISHSTSYPQKRIILEQMQSQLSAQQFRQTQACPIIRNIVNSYYMTIFADLHMTNDGVYRLTADLSQVSLGFTNSISNRVAYLPTLAILNVEQTYFHDTSYNQKDNVHQIISHLSQQGSEYLQQLCLSLKKFVLLSSEVDQFVKAGQYNKLQEMDSDQLFVQFTQRCFEHLRDVYTPANPNGMFVYNIGRIRLPFNLEISQTGYSQAYMDLIGMDADAITSLFLRRKQIDLIQSKQEISELTLRCLQNRLNCESQWDQVTSNVTTFDGFTIKLKCQGNMISVLPPDLDNCEFFFNIFEMDVDLSEIERLIEYRQKLATGSNMTLEEYLKKELSFLFEDVEYSVKSAAFFEKYYANNIKNLKKFHEKQKYKESIVKNRCSYRLISENNPSPIPNLP